MSSDISRSLLERVRDAASKGTPLQVVGNNTKAFLGRETEGQPLSVADHTGVVDYSATELVMTARAGTTLAELEQILAEHHQMLPFEPPQFDAKATIGGALAANTSGPARPWRGSVRDAVLGVRLINGQAQHLRFGGVVMKNVAGYDLSRFQAGALGTLGVITEISFKVLPKPAHELTLVFEASQDEALRKLAVWQRQPKPLTAATWIGGRLYVRLSGAEKAVTGTHQQWGGETLENKSAKAFWDSIREQTHAFFAGTAPLWRLSCHAATPVTAGAEVLIEWGGALRWIREDCGLDEAIHRYQQPGSRISLYRHGPRQGEVNPPQHKALQLIQQNLKQAMDPQGIFNPGRLYSWL